MNNDTEDHLLRSVALQNAQTILQAHRRMEFELLNVKAALEQKNQELQQQREWFEVTLSSIGDAVITTDTRERVTFMNPVAESLTGWRKEEATGVDLIKVFRIIDERTRLPAINPVAEVMREGRVVTLANHTALLTREGNEVAIEDRAAPIRDHHGKVIGAVMVFHDVKEKREASAKTQREIHRRQQVEETLQATDLLKDEFLAILAHELRNPLAPIRQAASIWNQANLSEEQLRWSQRVVERQSRHMSMLLDDLMDISRIKRGHLILRKEWTDLGAIVDAAIETAGPLIRSREHQLSIHIKPPDLHLEADPVRLTQILANLLNNAAKYTPPQGRIELAASLARGNVEIRIRDNGTGISGELLPHIFGIFFQSTAALDRVEGGLGLGLALVKGIVALHGGEVRVASDGLGTGSEFTLLIPVGEGPRASGSPVGSGSDNGIGAPHPLSRILIADDNRDMADSLALYMQLRGHAVNTVYSGEEALQSFEAQRPDIVILDIGMPKLNGYETARRMRTMDPDHKVLLLALTGWGQESDKRLAMEAGFDHHFTKPVNPEKLVELFENLKV